MLTMTNLISDASYPRAGAVSIAGAIPQGLKEPGANRAGLPNPETDGEGWGRFDGVE